MTQHEKDKAVSQYSQRMAVVQEQYGLTPEEMARMSELRPGDEISDYVGFPEVQAQILQDNRETTFGIGYTAVEVGAEAQVN